MLFYAPLKYYRILSSDISPTTDGHEKNNTPPASRASSEIRGVRRNRPTQDSGESSPLETFEKRCSVLPPPSPIKYSIILKYLIF
ncbi:hypothetical protein TNCV_907051 [Trichonephila clavipes]|nr:hypothetical protein TNCV_907051 [Trichonephila clavipes]